MYTAYCIAKFNLFGDSPIFQRLISPNGFYSERFLFWKVFIPKGRFSELYLVLWSERLVIRKVIAQTILIPKCHCSQQFLIRSVLIPKGRFSEIGNKNLSEQKPFRIKTVRNKHLSEKWHVGICTHLFCSCLTYSTVKGILAILINLARVQNLLILCLLCYVIQKHFFN